MPPITARLIPASPTVPLSEPLSLTLEVTGPRGLEVAAPRFAASNGGWSLEIAGMAARRESADGVRWRLPLRAEPARAGDAQPVELPPLRARVGGEWADVDVPPAFVRVTTALTADATPRPLAPWAEESTAFAPPWPVLALVAAAFAVVWWRKCPQRPDLRRELLVLTHRLDRDADPSAVLTDAARAVRRAFGVASRTPGEVGGAAGEWLGRAEELAFAPGTPDAAAVRELLATPPEAAGRG